MIFKEILTPKILLFFSQVAPNTHARMLPQGGATQRIHPVQSTNHKPEVQTPAPLSPIQEQAQSGIPQQPDPQAVLEPSPSLPQHTWYPQGGSTPINPMPQNVPPFLPANHLTLGQLPLVGHQTGGNIRAYSDINLNVIVCLFSEKGNSRN